MHSIFNSINIFDTYHNCHVLECATFVYQSFSERFKIYVSRMHCITLFINVQLPCAWRHHILENKQSRERFRTMNCECTFKKVIIACHECCIIWEMLTYYFILCYVLVYAFVFYLFVHTFVHLFVRTFSDTFADTFCRYVCRYACRYIVDTFVDML